MILLLENNIRGGISSVMGDRYVKSSDTKKILYQDAYNLCGHSMCQPLPFGKFKFDKNNKLEDVIKTPDYSDIGCFIEVDLKCADNIKEKTKNFPFAPVNKKINCDKFSDDMKTINPDTYTQLKN